MTEKTKRTVGRPKTGRLSCLNLYLPAAVIATIKANGGSKWVAELVRKATDPPQS